MQPLKQLQKELTQELRNDILPFWMENMVDNGFGGFYGRMDGHHQIHTNAEKGLVLNARILWSFSAAYHNFHDDRFLKMAERSYQYIARYFLDPEYGGAYWSVNFQGQPYHTKKQIYAQAFVIYGLTEFYKITQEEEVLNSAIDIYQKMEEFGIDSQNGGYFEAFDRQWKLLEDLRLSEKDANEKKSMNTHLHVLEAYTNLSHVWPDEDLKVRLNDLVNIFLKYILSPENDHFYLFFNEKWEVKSRTISFGHDIEGSWLLHEAALAVGDQKLIRKIQPVVLKMAKIALKEGMSADGALNNEISGGVLDRDKHWWPQAEAMVGFFNAYQISGAYEFLDQVFKIWNYIKSYLIDHENGEWFFRINADGQPYITEDKAGFWKCPYHNTRACLELMNRINSQYLS